jgi:hypothetical protein
MCIVVTITCPEKVEASRLEREFQDGATLFLLPRRSDYREKKTEAFNISDIQVGGCACGLLGEGASWQLDTWNLKSGMLPLLEETIVRLAQHLPGGFTFEAAWEGKDLPQTQSVSVTDLRSNIRENRVSTQTRYQIAGLRTK